MSEPDNFLSRWARRKRGAETPPSTGSCVPPESEPSRDPKDVDLENLDLESLPSIESINESTDIRSFLRSGVPAELTRSALRQAWASDPAIRDFIGIAENQWDFNDPNAIHGFGPLRATDDGAKLLARTFGGAEKAAEAIPTLVSPPLPAPTAVIASRNAASRKALPEQTPDRILPPADPAGGAHGRANNEDAEAMVQSSFTSAGRNDRPDYCRQHGSALPR
jgi:Protein of unknown function (DUF3306)